jgi:predicted dinucleotide-binding enzyme
MQIGIIGAGTVAQTLAKHFLPLGHEVMLSNTRGPASLALDIFVSSVEVTPFVSCLL